MRVFSIRDLERYSGVKQHTIRTWEKRFDIFHPGRTGNNIRHYTLDDVTLLLDISLLLKYGYRISSLVHLSHEKLKSKISILKFEAAKKAHAVHMLIGCMFSNNIELFEELLAEAINTWGLKEMIHDIALPFLERTEVLSYKDSSVEVHLIVTAIRRKLILGIENSKMSPSSSKTALLFLPEGEHYDLLLLYINYILKDKGVRVVYLGTNISLNNLKQIIVARQPAYLFTQMVSRAGFPLGEYIRLMKEHLRDAKMFVGFIDEGALPESTDNVRFFKYASMTNLP